MTPSDALFTVRVLTEEPGWLSMTWAAISPLIATALGGAIAYLATVGADKRKRKRDTYVLARSLAAELRAGQWIVKVHEPLIAQIGETGRIDTLRYIKTVEAAMPVARAAAASAGQFVVPVAEMLARFLLLSQNVISQQQGIIFAMREDKVLTDEKFKERMLFMGPIAQAMIEASAELTSLIDQHYTQKAT